ncbi:MAG: ankyrin repeat domain-containing protein, partial [Proteobacteria bacterium]|nr:ankyrin repeat domain-containing protein [Pseudomonadota bacterium]
MYWACFEGQKDLALELVNQNNVNYVEPIFGDTPLHRACKQGWLDIVEMLIEKYGCDPNMVTESGESLLHYACRYGHIDVVKLLIEKCGCDPKVRTKSNQTLLHYAYQYGNIYIVKYLINKQHLNPL